MAAFWDEIGRLRDLLKFEFYFKDREEHRRQVGEEMSRHNPAWEDRLRAGEADALLAEMRPLVSHIMVRPFVEAYRIVADVLVHDDVASGGDAEVTNRALGLGQQYVAQRRLRSSESVSVLLFQTGLQLARNRGLFEPDASGASGAGGGGDSDGAGGSGGAGGAGGSGGAGGADLAGRRADFLAELAAPGPQAGPDREPGYQALHQGRGQRDACRLEACGASAVLVTNEVGRPRV